MRSREQATFAIRLPTSRWRGSCWATSQRSTSAKDCAGRLSGTGRAPMADLKPKTDPKSAADLKLVADPSPADCKICSAPSPLYGVVDFNKSCIEQQGRKLPLSGHPIYFRRCQQCGFTFTTAFDGWDLDAFCRNIYNDEYVVVDPDYV